MKLLGTLLLWLVVLVVLGLISWGVTLYMEWPLWVAAAIFFGCVGFYFLVKFLRRVIIVMRSRSKLAQQSEPARVARQASPEVSLARKWKAAVDTLRRSSLRRLGNPLHVLPWYMVIGKTGTGKTTALTRARLSSPIQKVSQSARVEQTANYDWWYFDQAVVIDCAGRYVDAQDMDQDRREWELGLDLLARYRPKEGLDGLVLAISADRLAHPDKDALIEEGRVVRARIEQLIQMFGKRFPIYVLITKCDQLYGLEEWARQLPDNALEQAVGYLSDELTGDVSGKNGETQFLDGAFDSIGERLQKLRVALVARSADGSVVPELLLFPNELANLRPRLEIFLHACLADNPYLERPFLRGLFFSSGLQEGGAMSSVLGNMLPPVPQHPNANAGLFLHDFFGRVLPQDRYSSRPAELINRWRQMTQHIGLMAWLLISLAIGILITVSFVTNMQTISLVREKRPFDANFSGRLEDDVPTLVRSSEALAQIEQRNDSWRAQWMVISTNIDDLEDKLKKNYVGNFRKYVLPMTSRNYQEDFERVQVSDPDDEKGRLIRNVVRYINLLQARLHGAGRDALQAMPQRVHIVRYSPQLYQQINQLTVSHLAWTPVGDPYLTDRLQAGQTQLDRVAYADPQMSWLIGLVATDMSTPVVTANDFWNSSALSDTARAQQADIMVPAAYTKAGKDAIDAFLVEMEKSVDDGPKFLARRAAFESWYREQRIFAWQKFVTSFATAPSPLAGEPEWRTALGSITGVQSPYYRVIDRLTDEFAVYDDKDLPSWLLLAREFQQQRAQATRLGAANQAVKLVGAINSVGGKAVKETLSGSPQIGGRVIKNNLAAVETLGLYFTEVSKIAADSVSGSGRAYQIASDFHRFAVDPAVKTSDVHLAAERLVQLKKLMGYGNASDEVVWRLVEGPLHFALQYVEQQASCEVQKDWQAKVQFPLQTAPDAAAMTEQLYGEKGSVWAFADGIAKPFLERDGKRFRIVKTLGYSVPFTEAFLPTLNGAVDKRVTQLVSKQRQETQKDVDQLQAQQDVQVQAQIDKTLAEVKVKADAVKALAIPLTITAQPTSINSGALAKPFATILSIQCAAGAQQLNNFNFPVNTSFSWAPGQCGEVSLQIKIDTLVLTKKYPGPMGVAHFIQDFRGGVRQFDVDEFPSAKTGLDALNVRQIGVRYNFEGQEGVLKTVQQLDAFDKQEKENLQEKQRLQEQQFKQAQANIEEKLAAQKGPRMAVQPDAESWLPQQVGVCWDQRSMRDKPQDVRSMISDLVGKADSAPMQGPTPTSGPSSAPARAPAPSTPSRSSAPSAPSADVQRKP